jgi:hypothetical protein
MLFLRVQKNTTKSRVPDFFVLSCRNVQGSDPRSKLRAIRPSVTKVEYEGEPFIQAAPVQAGGQLDSDLMRNFMTELETLTFFIQANHDDNLLYHYSRVVFASSPLDFLDVKCDASSRQLNAIHVPATKKMNETEICLHVFSGQFAVGF